MFVYALSDLHYSELQSISDNILDEPVHASTPLASDYEDDELALRYSSEQGHGIGAQQTETEQHSRQMLHQRQNYEQVFWGISL